VYFKMTDETTPQIQEPISMIERAELAAKAMKEQNDRAEEIAKRNERAATIFQLGGGTNAGQQPQPKPIESDHDYRLRIEREVKEGKKEFS
jgi:hypothetical protein